MAETLKNRYDFLLLFDVLDGNPNGDPDAGNMPRVDAETGTGIVTDVCLKRKIRNFVSLTQGNRAGYDIFIKEKAILNNEIDKAFESDAVKAAEEKKKTETARDWMCRTYFDIRTFGAVMSTGKNAGQVRGPVQLTFARSADPVIPIEHSITRMAVATEKEAESQKGDNRTMGKKFTVPYGLYAAHGFVSPQLAAQTGFGTDDLQLLWDALKQMFEFDRSAARGLMSTRKLYVFKHDSMLGNAPSWQLFELVKTTAKAGTPRAFADYEVTVNRDALPAGVELLEQI